LPEPRTEKEYMERIDMIRALIRQQNVRMDAREAESVARWEKMDRSYQRTQRILDDLKKAQAR
jgi:hypothetical protein